MKQLLTLLLALIFISLYSCKKEDKNTATVDDKDSIPQVEDSIKTFDSTQIKTDEKYANIKWEELNLTDTCVLDICFDCGSLDKDNQVFYNQLQTAFETDCEDCLIQPLDNWNNATVGGNPDNENDTIQEIYNLFESYYLEQLAQNNHLNPVKATDYVYFLINMDNWKGYSGNIKYDFDYTTDVIGNETIYHFKPRATFGNIKLLDFELYKSARSCYNLPISKYDNRTLPASLTKFEKLKSTFFSTHYYEFEYCGDFDCSITVGGGFIEQISFKTENNVVIKAKLNLFFGDVNGDEYWTKDANGNWVKEETENKF